MDLGSGENLEDIEILAPTVYKDGRVYKLGVINCHGESTDFVFQVLNPPPKLKISEWAAMYGQLSQETSSQTGDFEAFPYQTGIMDSACDPKVIDTAVMKSARVGFTKCLDFIIAYYIHQDPSPVLVVQPRVEDAQDYSKTEIVPMFRDTPVLAEIAPDPKTKDGNNTVLKKVFKNRSSLTLVGANSPGGFRRITIRIVLFDEVDGYPVEGAGNEGDQISLGVKRTLTFWNRKIVLGSSPTIKDFSRIERSFEKGDQRYFMVPCPHCGTQQRLEWGGPNIPFGFKWEKDDLGIPLPETVYYLCKSGCVIKEHDKRSMVRAGEWTATRPFNGHASFHIWAAYSFFPNASWENLVREWLDAKNDPLQRQTFYNLVLGLPYDDFGMGVVSKEAIEAREKGWEGDVPLQTVCLTAGVDVQDYRVEIEIIAWGPGEESWSVDYVVVEGDVESDSFWFGIETYLQKGWLKPNGNKMYVQAACVDSGGHHTQKVYDFCKARLAKKFFAIKGAAERGGRRNPVWPTARPVNRKKKTFKPVILGVNAAKDVIRSRLMIEEPGPGFMHFPPNRGTNYYAQLTAEKLVAKVVDGYRIRVWELPPGRANEALDVRVYGYAALCSLKQFGFKVGGLTVPDKVPEVRPVQAPGYTGPSVRIIEGPPPPGSVPPPPTSSAAAPSVPQSVAAKPAETKMPPVGPSVTIIGEQPDEGGKTRGRALAKRLA